MMMGRLWVQVLVLALVREEHGDPALARVHISQGKVRKCPILLLRRKCYAAACAH